MENKDDLISRGAVLNMLRYESVMHTPYEQYEAAARKHLAEDMSKQVKTLPGQMTAEEVWDIARRITCDEVLGGFSNEELGEIFDTVYPDEIFNRFTPEEAKVRIAEWEKELTIHKDLEEVINSCRVVLEDFMKSSRQ